MISPIAIPAYRGLVRRPLQTILLVFALSIALAATMTIMAILAGVDVQMREDLQRIGMDVINIHISPELRNLLFSPLKASDADEISEEFGGVLAPFRVSMGMGHGPSTATDEPANAQVLVLNTTPDWGRVVPLEFIDGRFFREGESGTCVLDEWVAETLFGDTESAVGRTLDLNVAGTRTSARIVGVMRDPFEIRKRFDELDVTGSARSRMLRMMEFKSVYVPASFEEPDTPIHGAVLKVKPGDDPEAVALALRNKFEPENKVWAWSRGQWVNNVLSAAEVGLQLANVIWVIVLGVTGVMILTVSLVAVRERFREIAIRRTEGAGRKQIAAQLLAENILLSLVAGLIAIGLAHWAGATIEARYISWTPAFLPGDVLLALGCGMLMGGLATVLPAMHASGLDPVAVLRNS